MESRATNVSVLMISLLVCTIMCPGSWARSYNDQRRSPPASPGIDNNPMHGPSSDDHDLPGDLRQPYPGKSFGPMGPVVGQFPDDVALRNLANGNTENHANDPHAPAKPLREYQVFHVEFHRVETPFVIGIWIFFASIAKIGKSINRWIIRSIPIEIHQDNSRFNWIYWKNKISIALGTK